MQSRYIYAGTRAKAREYELLSDAQREMLLGSHSVAELTANLENTYLGPYLEDGNIEQAIEDSITDTKNLIDHIAPEPDVFSVLWFKYDLYNLKAAIKGTLAEQQEREIRSLCYTTGLYTPEAVIRAYADGTLATLDTRLKAAADEAHEHTSMASVDLVLNLHFLTAARDIAREHNDAFMQRYVTLLIDLFNCVSALRLHVNSIDRVVDPFVEGGTFSARDLEERDDALSRLTQTGGQPRWKEALEDFHSTGSFARIEKVADDYIAEWISTESNEIFSAAPLVSYFTAKKNNAQFIRTVYVAKQTGLAEQDLRKTIRMPYSSL